jgi:hypothetical protein
MEKWVKYAGVGCIALQALAATSPAATARGR